MANLAWQVIASVERKKKRRRSSGYHLPSQGGGIDRLLVEVEVDADRLEMLDRASRSTGDRSSRSMAHAITTSILRRLAPLEQGFKTRAAHPCLGAADAGIA